MDLGMALGRELGIEQETIDGVADWPTSPTLTEDQRLVCEYADVLTRTPVNVSDDLRERLAVRFGEGQIVELTQLIAVENARGRFNRAFGIEPDGYDSPSS